MKAKIIYIASLVSLLFVPTGAAAQSGGGFEITEAVITTGGGGATNGILDADVVIGQSVQTGSSGSGIFTLTSGFWNYTPLAPTAASISISGRVLNGAGGGVASAAVYLQGQDGELRVTKSTSFGHYRFDNILTGQAVLISVQARRFVYSPRTIFAVDEITGFDFFPDH